MKSPFLERILATSAVTVRKELKTVYDSKFVARANIAKTPPTAQSKSAK